MNRVIKYFKIMLIAIVTLLLCTCSKAKATDIVKSKKISSEELNITSSSDKVEDGEKFNIAIDLEEPIAAYTLWVYFDSDKVECISEIDNLNIVENKLIYTWFSETGKNQKLEHLAQIDFKSKEDGVAAFSVIGEFFNEKGEEIQVNSDSVDVKIGEESITSMSEIVSVDDSKNNAKLDIMRLGIEGITPDFSPDVNEYYLIVDENVKDIDVTAIPQNAEANVRITGNKNLKNGLNKIEIDVTSEDKSEKNKYTINVTKTSNEQNANADLETLAIENYVLTPEFDANETNYTVNVSNNTNNLNILAIASDMNAKVNVTGNTNLKYGNNKVVITVTAENGITLKKYNINAYKRNDNEQAEYEKEKKEAIEQANAVLEQMSTEDLHGNDEEIETNEVKRQRDRCKSNTRKNY